MRWAARIEARPEQRRPPGGLGVDLGVGPRRSPKRRAGRGEDGVGAVAPQQGGGVGGGQGRLTRRRRQGDALVHVGRAHHVRPGAGRSLTTASGYGNPPGGGLARMAEVRPRRRARGRLRPTLTQAEGRVDRRPGGPGTRGALTRRSPADPGLGRGRHRPARRGRPRGRAWRPLPAAWPRPGSGARRRGGLAAPQRRRCLLLYRACWRLGAVAAPVTTAWAPPRWARHWPRSTPRSCWPWAVPPPPTPPAPSSSTPGTGSETCSTPWARPRRWRPARWRCDPPTSPWRSSRPGRRACPRPPCTPTGASATRPRSWWSCTACAAATPCSCPPPWRTSRAS